MSPIKKYITTSIILDIFKYNGVNAVIDYYRKNEDIVIMEVGGIVGEIDKLIKESDDEIQLVKNIEDIIICN